MASDETVVDPGARTRVAVKDEPSSGNTDPPPKVDSVHAVAPGSVLAGKYRVSEVIGKGGMGLVVEARHLQLDTRVAIKLLFPEMMSYAEATERFLREARAASRLESRHVTRVLDVGTLDSGEPFMVMERLVGDDLATHSRTHAPIPIEDAVDYVVQACDAIAEAHEIGIVHRDIKPANLFLVRRPDGEHEVKVLDFGISKVLGDGGSGGERDVALTQTTTILGSALYMSPEQMQSAKKVDHRTDIYALGVCLFELLGGELPYFAESFPELCAKVYTEPPRSLKELRPEVPDGLVRVVERAIAHAPDQRFPRVAELVHALAPFAGPDTKRRIDALLRRHAPTLAQEKPASSDGRRTTARTSVRREAAPDRGARRGGGMFVWVGIALVAAGAGALAVAREPAWLRAVLGEPSTTPSAEPAPEDPSVRAANAEPAPHAPASVAPASSSATLPAALHPDADAGVAPASVLDAGARLDAGATSSAAASAAPAASAGAPASTAKPAASTKPTSASAHAGNTTSTSKPSSAKSTAPTSADKPSSGGSSPPIATVAAPPVDNGLSVEHCYAHLPDGSKKEVPCN